MKAARIRDECQEEREESLALLPPRAHTRENHGTNECRMHLRAPGPSLSPLTHLLEFIGEDLYLLLIFVFFLRVL